jgi:GDPmannose 4,6-dehydratase
VDLLVGDATKAKEKLGWEPKYSLEDGLAKVVDYLRDKSSGCKSAYVI